MLIPTIKVILVHSEINLGISLEYLFLNCILGSFHKMFKSVMGTYAIALLGICLTEMKTVHAKMCL